MSGSYADGWLLICFREAVGAVSLVDRLTGNNDASADSRIVRKQKCCLVEQATTILLITLEVANIARLRVSAFKYGVICNYELSCGNNN